MTRKATFVCMLLTVLCCQAHAQDTVYHGDSCYLFNPGFETCTTYNRSVFMYDTCAYTRHAAHHSTVQRYSVSQPTLVYGIAVTYFRNSADTSTSGVPVALYINADTAFVPVDSIMRYSKRTNFMYVALSRGTTDTVRSVSPCYEYYFREPHLMNGPFYVGYSYDQTYRMLPSAGADPFTAGLTLQAGQPWFFISNMRPMNPSSWGCVFPIVQPERIGCEGAVAEVAESGGDYAVLEWEMGGDSCQLSVAPYDMPIDSGLVVDLTANRYTAMGLDTGVYYAARLRTQCHHSCHIHADTVVWSDWGVPTMFYLGSEEPDTSGIGIRRVEEAVEFSVTPNPARGTATVRCEAGVQSVEVVSATGATVLSLGGGGAQACVLDLAGLVKGVYVVRIATPQGTVAQKLAVE